MNTISKFALAGFVALALATGCDDHDHDHDHSGATTQGAAAQDHGHGHGHDHAHGGETHEPLGLENAGPYEVAPVQLGKLKPGGEIAFDVEILGQGQPRPKAVRFWIGAADGAGATREPPESDKDNVYHVDLPVPPTVTADTRLHVEIEPASGGPATASFALKR